MTPAASFTIRVILVAIILAMLAAVSAPRGTPVPSPLDPASVPAAELADVRPVGSGGAFLGAPDSDGVTTTALDAPILPAAALPSASAHDASVPAPSPTGGIGTALLGGWATYCAPTPRYCQGWAPPALLGAMPGFSYGDKPFLARVCTNGIRCVVVTVVSFCGCGDRSGIPTVIDLSPAAFDRLASRSRGVVRVTVEYPVDRPSVTLPPTDLEAQP